eukprot:g5551.t1
MDADFLKKHVGDALTGGMSAVNLYQPADPVEFLGQYLLKYVANAEQNERDNARKEELSAFLKTSAEEAAASEAKAAEAKAAADAAAESLSSTMAKLTEVM